MKTKKNSYLKEFFLKICNLISNHWLFTTIFLTGSSWWFSLILGFFGESLGLIVSQKRLDGSEYKTLSIVGVCITFIILIIHIILTICNRYRETNNEDKKKLKEYENQLEIKEQGYDLFDKMLTTVGNICRHKYSTQLKTIENIKYNNMVPPVVFTEPCKQLEEILTELSSCIAFLLSEKGRKFNRDDIYCSIAYNFPSEKSGIWKWADIGKEQGLSIEDLVKKGTTFSYLLNNATEKQPSVFFNSKQEAYVNRQYQPDECDKYDSKGELKGSIACFKINIKKSDNVYVIAVLSISSYDKPFVDNITDDADKLKKEVENLSKNMENVIVHEMSERIRIELCNYYLQFLRKEWDKSNK